jgi:hypothetical protein
MRILGAVILASYACGATSNPAVPSEIADVKADSATPTDTLSGEEKAVDESSPWEIPDLNPPKACSSKWPGPCTIYGFFVRADGPKLEGITQRAYNAAGQLTKSEGIPPDQDHYGTLYTWWYGYSLKWGEVALILVRSVHYPEGTEGWQLYINVYDDSGRLSKWTIIAPNSTGTWDPLWQTCVYDEAGNYIKTVWFNGYVEVIYSWDAAGRIKSMEYCAGCGRSPPTSRWEWTYPDDSCEYDYVSLALQVPAFSTCPSVVVCYDTGVEGPDGQTDTCEEQFFAQSGDLVRVDKYYFDDDTGERVEDTTRHLIYDDCGNLLLVAYAYPDGDLWAWAERDYSCWE